METVLPEGHVSLIEQDGVIDAYFTGPFEIETESGRKFIVYAADESEARVKFGQMGATEVDAGKGNGAAPLASFGPIVRVVPEPPPVVTLQEGPLKRR